MSTNKQTKSNRLVIILAIALVAMVCLIAKNLYKANNSTIALVNPAKYLADPTDEGDDETTVGSITVKYVDEDGVSVKPDETLPEGELGDEYSVQAPTVEGYTIDESQYPTNRIGNYSTKNQTVTFVYSEYADDVETSSDGENVTITVLKNRNLELSKEYSLVIYKKDQAGETLPGATFKVSRPNESILRWDKDYTGKFIVGTLIMDDTDTETYTIKEDPAPEHYDGIASDITLTITKEVRDDEVFASANINNVEGAAVTVDEENKEIKVTITNQRQYDSQDYTLIIKTFDSEDDSVLPGASYKVVKDGETDPIINQLDDTGTLEVGTLTIDSEGTDKYTITQTPPALYDAISGDIELTITKAKDSNTFLYKVTDAQNNEIEGVSTELKQDEKQIIVTVKNTKTPIVNDPKDYTVYIKTVDDDGNALSGATYSAVDGNSVTVLNKVKDTTGTLKVKKITVADTGTETYTITEDNPAEGYEALVGNIVMTLTKTLDEENHKYGATAAINTLEGVTLEVNQTTGDIFITIKKTPLPKEKIFDLTIDKAVKVAEVTSGGKTTTMKKTGDKILKIDIPKSKINGSVIKVTYTITVKNVGEIAGYATEVTDPVPSGMVLIDSNWKLEDGKAKTDKLADKLIEPGKSETIDITFSWTVTEKDVGTKINEALISKSRNDEGVPDRTPDEVAKEPIILAVTTGNRAVITVEFLIALVLATGLVYVIKRKNDKE